MNAVVPPESRISPPTPDNATESKFGRVTPRAVVLAVLLTVVNDFWIVQLEVVRYSFATYAAPFYNVIFTLLVVTALNFWFGRRLPRLALSRVELLTIYVMVSVSSAVCSHNMMEILVSSAGYASFFQTPTNQWGTLFVDKLPKWLIVSDSASLRNFYFGNSTLYDPTNYRPWIVPALMWSTFCFVLLYTMLCLNTILRKQWMESERLTFPIVTLPLEMTAEGGEFFRNRYMWLGFGVAGTITFVAGLNYLYPSIPCIPIVRTDIGRYITTPPWNAIGGIPMGFYFWAICLSFLMPLELSFSCWFFFWLTRFELVGTRIMGLNDLQVLGGGFDRAYPFLNSQSYGAYLGFFVMSMWTSRHYLGRVFRTAFLGTKEEDESREAISYRKAIIGALAGVLFLSWFAHQIVGMSLWVVAVFFVFYFVFVTIIVRIRAELGFPVHDMHVMAPQYMIMTTAGTERLPQQNLIGFSLFFWFNRTYASHPAPHQMEGFKLAERTNTPARHMFYAIVIAAIFAMPIGFWALLHNYYHYGAATAKMEQWAMGFGNQTWTSLDSWIRNRVPSNTTAMGFVGVGFLASMLLGWMRVRFLWFPFHPLAYAMSNSWGVGQLWMPLMIGSACKFMSLRFGGLKTYRRALPFFLGLMLGEIAIGSLWTIVGIALGIPTYDFWPGRYR